ncbi:hypothetical protein R5R35_006801 [Gryllus longicercus]|uniref:Uncharacterized protein n=1 Tax=Gryllus longicercus TaxID=2509291 RepID=A0AAN9V0A0_9ORTH
MTSATAALAAAVAPAAPPPPPPLPAAAGGGPEPSEAATDDEQPESLGLELDLWEGQFEFVGPDYGEHAPPSPALSLSPSPSRGLKFGSNGVRKNEARAWCEELTEQKAVLEHSSCEDLISMWHALLEKSDDADLLKVCVNNSKTSSDMSKKNT